MKSSTCPNSEEIAKMVTMKHPAFPKKEENDQKHKSIRFRYLNPYLGPLTPRVNVLITRETTLNTKNPRIPPTVFKIRSSTSKLPTRKIYCKHSTVKVEAITTNIVFLNFKYLSNNSGRKNPSGIKARIFPARFVMTILVLMYPVALI